MSEYGGYRYLINMNSVEFSIQEDDSLNNYDCENELSDEMKSSKENAGSDEKGNDNDNIIVTYNKNLFHLN
ncbi:15201_t:CDS:2 [Entrophospora sp. SA101]|nr:14884_t:CDS:2 [Entrophospora sp. SA101]CAJ0752380.1 15201_t:CDS:2 [Entrophospora sp. SA101]CAJ0858498.1 21921_t:CDS:2 [Entrophospora sp. SA101]CAJ0902630.1 5379_t:CDS:2 [Entrophospora sp. SA101]